jgi:hypothetical protein
MRRFVGWSAVGGNFGFVWWILSCGSSGLMGWSKCLWGTVRLGDQWLWGLVPLGISASGG